METTEKNRLSGGSFIIDNNITRSIFTPEDFSEEQLMMKAAVKEFVQVMSIYTGSEIAKKINA